MWIRQHHHLNLPSSRRTNSRFLQRPAPVMCKPRRTRRRSHTWPPRTAGPDVRRSSRRGGYARARVSNANACDPQPWFECSEPWDCRRRAAQGLGILSCGRCGVLRRRLPRHRRRLWEQYPDEPPCASHCPRSRAPERTQHATRAGLALCLSRMNDGACANRSCGTVAGASLKTSASCHAGD